MSFSLNGTFWPTTLPLFHGSRRVALLAVPMMVSHRIAGPQKCALARFRSLSWVNQAAGRRRPPKVSHQARRQAHTPGQLQSLLRDVGVCDQ
jgi:hypothetical protein